MLNTKHEIHGRIYKFALRVLYAVRQLQITIAKKEAKETYYWLSLLFDYNAISKNKTASLLDENKQIISILSKIILNAKK